MCTLLLLVASIAAVNLTWNGSGAPSDRVPSISKTTDAEATDAQLPALQVTSGPDYKISLMIFRHN